MKKIITLITLVSVYTAPTSAMQRHLTNLAEAWRALFQPAASSSTTPTPPPIGIENTCKQCPIGLTNCGNTCWANSILQALFNMPYLMNEIEATPGNPTAQHLKTLYDAYKHHQGGALPASAIQGALHALFQELNIARQGHAEEYRIGSPNNSRDGIAAVYSKLLKIGSFREMLESNIKINGTGSVFQYETIAILSPAERTVSEYILKTMGCLTKPARYITATQTRMGAFETIKDMRFYPETLPLRELSCDNAQITGQYKLIAIIRNLKGHFTVYVKKQDGWYLCDDAYVSGPHTKAALDAQDIKVDVAIYERE